MAAFRLTAPVVDRIEAHQGDEDANVGLGQPLAEQERSAAPEMRLERVQHRENVAAGFRVGLLIRGEAGAVDAVVQRRVDLLVQGVDLGAQVVRVEVGAARDEPGEGGVEHAQDVGRLVVDDRLSMLVPQNGHARPP